MKKTLFLVLSVCSFLMQSQQHDGGTFNSHFTDPYADMTPKTPSGASFSLYGNTPVNLSSGLPSISIPLYTIEVDGVQVPISLSYHASGVKVDDIATVVGLKWTLNAGGGIYRTVNDVKDEGTDGNNGWTSMPNNKTFNFWVDNYSQGYPYGDSGNNDDLELLVNHFDNYPDNYSYSFLNYSGSLLLNYDSEIIKGNEDGLNIEIWNPNLNLAKIKDLYGNQYEFISYYETNIARTIFSTDGDQLDISRDESRVGSMLSFITTKNNNLINFEYIPYDYFYDLLFASQRLVRAPHFFMCDFPFGSEESGSLSVTNESFKKTRVKYNNTIQLISKISTDNVDVEFQYLDGDIIVSNGPNITIDGWDKRLSKIIITDKLKNKQKEYNFKYGVFDGATNSGSDEHRLKLLEVSEKGFDNMEKPPYKFTYNEQNGLPELGTSFSKDYKGFYNGKDNSSLIAKSEMTLETNFNGIDVYTGLSDRYFDNDYLQTGVLTHIEYPTGGKTEYIYEPNANGSTIEPQLRIVEDEINTDLWNLDTSKQFSYHKYSYSKLVEMKNVLGKIEINDNQSSIHPFCICTDDNGDPANCLEEPLFRIYKYDGSNINDAPSVYFTSTYINESNKVSQSLVHPYSNGYSSNYSSFENSSPSAHDLYIVVLFIGGDVPPGDPNNNDFDPNNDTFIANYSWHEKMLDENDNIVMQEQYFGGLRIKEIKDLDSDDNVFNHKKYTYNSSYFHFTSQFFSSNYKRTIAGQDIYSSEMIPEEHLQIVSGYAYTDVEIKNEGVGNNGKIIERYDPKRVFNNIAGGDLIERIVLNSNEEILEITQNEYETLNKSYLSFKIPSLMKFPDNGTYNCGGDHVPRPKKRFHGDHGYPDVEYNGISKTLISNKNTKFLKQGSSYNPITTVTNYLYNDNLLITKEETDTQITGQLDPVDETMTYNATNLDGEIIEVEYTYPDDDIYDNEPLLTGVPIAFPVSKKVINTGDLILGQYFEYDSNGNIVATYKYNKGEASHSGPSYIPANYEKTVSFLTSGGKPTQITKKDGISTAYIWDSSKTYLLAEVINATHSNASSFLNTNLSIYSNTDIEIANDIDLIRQGLPDAQVTTYIYDPLIGVTRVVDPRGKDYFYIYDDLGRLKYVKDQDDNILSKNEYNYKTN